MFLDSLSDNLCIFFLELDSNIHVNSSKVLPTDFGSFLARDLAFLDKVNVIFLGLTLARSFFILIKGYYYPMVAVTLQI